MEFSVLGPLRVSEGGHSYTPTAPKQRQLLALLLLNANQVVSTSACIDELWEDAPPNTALSTIQSYILQLRRALGRIPRIGSLQAARRVLETRDGGYLLVVRGDELDAHRFTALVRQGRARLRRDDAGASRLLGEALRMWHGSALSDVQAGPVLRAHLVGLAEDRISVQEQRIDADLRLGRHHELLGELSALSAQHPTQEYLHAQLVIALYRSGRRTQALEVVQRLRQVMRDELGLEPSPRIQELHQAVLVCDPLIDKPVGTDSVVHLPGCGGDGEVLCHDGPGAVAPRGRP
ncbi:AfsR/SARP family transcriptional regulator [Streptomyces sp. LX-29]|uniref:AfsR/SARP family transcriptional regulator n=1 Tax=Streptomyces sp. LX-29 TaxID=2900152 RepID=UPI00240E731E|nr:AfsR/SARP family transcriptional regulator [Streptomyces sp. LX-29]WFB09492.1 AfsR/SARP family transcriptional regulator [Streptomyces sp. LX-29]